ncbi:hypothetical protein PSDVSF_25010 [Pseudodesulfovibrio sediminis]|uniref:histidine kinase n=2 Tax=Pseudodesulfovibrio sediminis TaxID=2810563 RepID=A0ABM7P8F0_9BACT|nr:hypothetical protein PSDVSF_25010 [Pseudodesulfovibrio sediminis]
MHILADYKSALDGALNARLHLANSLNHSLSASPTMSQEEFEALSQGLLAEVGGIRSMHFARGTSISLVYPASELSKVGAPLSSLAEGGVRALALLAMEKGQSQMIVTHEKGHDAILTVLVPVFAAETDTVIGVVSVVADATTFFRESELDRRDGPLLLGLRSPESQGTGSIMLAGAPVVFDMNPEIREIALPSGIWQLAGVPKQGWGRSPYGTYILAGGGVCIFLIPVSLWAVLIMIMGRFKDREKYRQLVQNAKSIILHMDLAGTITFCNEYAEEFYGYDPGELIGKPLVGSLIPEKDLEGNSMKRYWNRLLKTPSAHPFNETVNMRKNGEIVWVAWANDATVASDGTTIGLLCVGTDITDRKLMEEALRQREKQYRLLAENVSDVIWGLDADTRFTYVSPSDETVRGFKRYDVLGRHVEEFLSPASKARFMESVAALDGQMVREGTIPSITEDMEFICADGSTVWLEVHIGLLLNDDGEKIGMQGVGRDITDRKLAEALREDVERMAKHDLKTPLGAVIGLPAEIRSRGGLSPAQKTMLETVENAGKTMLQLINRSLDLYKMECGTYVLNRVTVDVLAIFERIKAEVQPQIRDKGISIGLEMLSHQSDRHFPVNGDEELLCSMLSNLLLNALEASPDSGAIVITLDKREKISLSIRNQGEVPAAIRDTFFEKYSTANTASGSGLGTYSARLIARTHGGDITVDTDLPGQTTIKVTLPLATPLS